MHHPTLIKLKPIIFTLILMLFANQLLAQNNNGIFFQAVARDNYQNPANNRKIFIVSNNLRFIIFIMDRI